MPNWPKFEPKSSTYTGVEGMYFVLIISECFVYFFTCRDDTRFHAERVVVRPRLSHR